MNEEKDGMTPEEERQRDARAEESPAAPANAPEIPEDSIKEKPVDMVEMEQDMPMSATDEPAAEEGDPELQPVGDGEESEDVPAPAKDSTEQQIDETETAAEEGDPELQPVRDSEEPEEQPEIETQEDEIDTGKPDIQETETPEVLPHAEPSQPAQEFESPEAGEDDGRAWYVVHCYSGYENKVRHNLEQRIESMGMKDLIFDVVVPTEEEIEVKEGKRRTVERRVFPGYILVNMNLSEESWYVVRNTPGVTSFVGQGNTPLPLRPEEVSQIIKRMEADAPRIKVTFKQGERVRIVDGPFNDFRGTVSEIDMERAKVRVMVNFFGRETPVELDFLQVEKA